MKNSLSKPKLNSPKVIEHPDGNIYRGLRSDEPEFVNFGELYFSSIKKNHCKAWKQHLKMTMNLIVPVGSVKFVLLDHINNPNNIYEFTLNKSPYQKLFVPPNWWMGFYGLEEENLILNIADIIHDKNEIKRAKENTFKYKWK